jgi:hypothetical protein
MSEVPQIAGWVLREVFQIGKGNRHPFVQGSRLEDTVPPERASRRFSPSTWIVPL